MSPATGDRLLRFTGDSVRFSLSSGPASDLPSGWRAFLRTNLGRATLWRQEVIKRHFEKMPLAGAYWRDLPMDAADDGWSLALPLTEVGYFEAKAYALDPEGRQHWPEGGNVGVSVHPNSYRSGNTIYCAFPRLFGETKGAAVARNEVLETQLKSLDKKGYTIIPASGTLRDLRDELPHIFDTLGCRILHLLPINPTPTTYARFGRYGSPYAATDLMSIDPALVEFDRRTTGVDQFKELAYAVHAGGGRLLLDLAINHTGWGSHLQEVHPEWFLRESDGTFHSPGAWGTVWEDLVESDHRSPKPWEYFADVFLTWCQRGVDGFRCDAGYMIPWPAWEYITARVREEFPETLFLLEGLGGSWEATEKLLTYGGMQWAYSELFQNYSPIQISGYLDHGAAQQQRVGTLVNYSETHDNDRLAVKGREWSLLRNRLCALSSASGAYGFTNGVEWLATEKILVHQCAGLRWGDASNLMPEISRLNQLLANHPCFFDGAEITRLSPADSPVLALRRVSADGFDRLLVLVNTDPEDAHELLLPRDAYEEMGSPQSDLLGQSNLAPFLINSGNVAFLLQRGAAYCLGTSLEPRGLSGALYRNLRALHAWALTELAHARPIEEIGSHDWKALAELIADDPVAFLSAISHLDRLRTRGDLVGAVRQALTATGLPRVVRWAREDARRTTLVPPDHWLFIEDQCAFRATLDAGRGTHPLYAESIASRSGHFVSFAPRLRGGDAILTLERYAAENKAVLGTIRFLDRTPAVKAVEFETGLALLTNGRGGMARIPVDLGTVRSKYDCVLGANLHPDVPTDRHVFAKRVRAWAVADGFISPLTRQNLIDFDPGPPARWRFVATAGDGRAIEVHLIVDMLDQMNTTVLRFVRPAAAPPVGVELNERFKVSLTVRVDIEDRNFHQETRHDEACGWHFHNNIRPLQDEIGFEFTPSADRRLTVASTSGRYHHEAEWSDNIPHPIEHTRGQTDHGDAYSPGWFELPLGKGSDATLVISAEPVKPPPIALTSFVDARELRRRGAESAAGVDSADELGRALAYALQAFVVKRGKGKTVIAGYPWFLDWGRDSLICARGMLAAGLVDEVRELLCTFARFEKDGTLPNSIYGEDASNRDTSDAPLWLGIICEDLASKENASIYDLNVNPQGRRMTDVLRSIAEGYIQGTPNGIRMDSGSGLIWSPKHFTWMDTNYPAGTPREGYPIEIQALWIRLLRQLDLLNVPSGNESWRALAERAVNSLQQLYWIEQRGYYADLLIAHSGQPASEAQLDNALRSNCLFAISLGLADGRPAQRCVEMALRHLVVPGALRTLAPLPVNPPLPVYGNNGQLLNDPANPYWGRYEGDEDTRRKPAYHNGTAWVWTFPTFCEALARAWSFSPEAVETARSYLGSIDALLRTGCLGKLPEIIDGDYPHQPRGCDAQAWSVTEAFRVWKILRRSLP